MEIHENAAPANHFHARYYRKSPPITSNHRQSPCNHHANQQPITFQSPLLHRNFPVYCFHGGLWFYIILGVPLIEEDTLSTLHDIDLKYTHRSMFP